jgi:hypothetical protein
MKLAPDTVERTKRAGKEAQEASDAAMKTSKAAMQIASDARKAAECAKRAGKEAEESAAELQQLINQMKSTVKGPQQMIGGPRTREVRPTNKPARDHRNEEERAEEAARKARREADARERLHRAGLPVETDNQRAPVYTTGTQRCESVSSRDGQRPYVIMNDCQTSMPVTELSRVTAHQLARPDGADSITSMVVKILTRSLNIQLR